MEKCQNPLLHASITPPCPYGAVKNFCRMRSSGYCGKKTSAMKTLFAELENYAGSELDADYS